ncbi:MAG: hypothetical protein FJX74_04905 [Armatimonadetes bacterium]|nr:hypothetical protein [Armatimonadota bacterium]
MSLRRLVILVTTGLAALAPALSADFGVLVQIGLQDREPTEWRGRIELQGGAVERLRGSRFGQEDGLDEGGAWHLTTDAVPQTPRPQTAPNGILVEGNANPGAVLTITAGEIRWDIPLAGLRFGTPLVHESGALSVQIAPPRVELSGATGEADYPGACALPDGSLLAVWQVYEGGNDRLMYAIRRNGEWGPAADIPGLAGDLYQPKCAPAADGGFWVVCASMLADDFDLYALRFDGERWSEPVNISHAPGHDFNQTLWAAETGEVYCVWQGFRNGSSDILLAACRDAAWREPTRVADSPANEWAPAIAGRGAQTYVAYDTYEHGSYDVYLARIVDGRAAERTLIAGSPRFEAKASVAIDVQGRVWIAWQDAGEDWAKDTGYTVPQAARTQGIYGERNLKVACFAEGRLAAAPDVSLSMPEGERRLLEEPRLCATDDGRVWLALRHPATLRRAQGQRVYGERAWEEYATYLSGDAWAPALYLPANLARIDTFPAIVPSGEGVMLVCHSDNRGMNDPRKMTRNTIFAAAVTTAEPVSEAVLTPVELPTPTVVRENEASHLARARAYVADPAGRTLRLLRGDTHRHTEVSWDGTGDGSVLDAYRYAMDAAALDFFMVSDHNQRTGVDLEYVRRRCYKLADLHHNPPAFTTLFGYERSLGYPDGHRNVVNARRDYDSFRFTGQQNDLDLLYEYCRRERAIVIPHTIGTNHGTNWYAFDLGLEPVVEIFQGCRTNYEYEGAPKSATPGDPQADNTGYRPQGFLWRAWQRDLRLGILCSSDHGSTHYSYAGVYCAQPSREGVIEAIKGRRTFGATDNLIIDLRVGDHFMGEDWTQDQPPAIDVKVLGTAPLERVELIRDFQFVYTHRPEGAEASFTWLDNDFTPGTHLYYVRAEQADESIAWGSPVWITKG